MESLRIDTGIKRLLINDGPEVLEFNPTDLLFAERFYAMYGRFGEKEKEFERRATKLNAANKDNPENTFGEELSFLKETCEYLLGEIDGLFGAGTSKKLFGETYSLEAIGAFFQGVVPYIQSVRAQKVAQYVPAPPGTTKRKAKPKVMR